MYKLPVLITCLLVLLLLVSPVHSRVGVGIGTSSIDVEEILRPGSSYNLPSLTVFNTGDEHSRYTVSVEYSEDAEEKRPPAEWFYFHPRDFYLEPNQQQVVEVRVELPITGVEMGDYFAFLQAQPDHRADGGTTAVGVAAATRLNFTVGAANIFQATFNRLTALHNTYHPWSTAGIGVIIGATIIYRFRKTFDIQIKKK